MKFQKSRPKPLGAKWSEKRPLRLASNYTFKNTIFINSFEISEITTKTLEIEVFGKATTSFSGQLNVFTIWNSHISRLVVHFKNDQLTSWISTKSEHLGRKVSRFCLVLSNLKKGHFDMRVISHLKK